MLVPILGPRLVADSDEWGAYAWSEYVLGIPGGRIAGGTDEVMRNIVGERVLGLPKEPKLESGAHPHAEATRQGEPKLEGGAHPHAEATRQGEPKLEGGAHPHAEATRQGEPKLEGSSTS
jgi:hypothetical protein